MKEYPLLGKVIKAVYVAEDKQAIKFEFEDGSEITAYCDADCCSYTWIENVENPEFLIDSPILEASNLDMPEADHPEDKDREVVAYYGFKISTIKGTCVIDYRNESNGYYGGNLSWQGDYFYGGVFGQNKSKEVWIKL